MINKVDEYFNFKSSILVEATFISIEEIHTLRSENNDKGNLIRNSINEETSRDTGNFKASDELSKEVEQNDSYRNFNKNRKPNKLKGQNKNV